MDGESLILCIVIKLFFVMAEVLLKCWYRKGLLAAETTSLLLCIFVSLYQIHLYFKEAQWAHLFKSEQVYHASLHMHRDIWMSNCCSDDYGDHFYVAA